ncbi:MAG: hypothetical protein LBT47_10555, partial [Deltaproteobacteria bacterium]|nr:hypothetical protein [Deltaproteobacteria bacterium]
AENLNVKRTIKHANQTIESWEPDNERPSNCSSGQAGEHGSAPWPKDQGPSFRAASPAGESLQ